MSHWLLHANQLLPEVVLTREQITTIRQELERIDALNDNNCYVAEGIDKIDAILADLEMAWPRKMLVRFRLYENGKFKSATEHVTTVAREVAATETRYKAKYTYIDSKGRSRDRYIPAVRINAYIARCRVNLSDTGWQ